MPFLLFTRADAEMCAQSDHRTIGDIVWGCLITIFACTWIAVHPNIPARTDSRWCVFKRGLSTMIYALIAPELMVAWALHQYLGARQIMHKYNKDCDKPGDVKWTKTHGFFIQMGGFMLYRDGLPVEVLTYESFKEHIDKKEIDVPRITERTINDKSKSDYLSKGFVVVQTTWFVVQCIARWARSLPLVELEVVTLAFAVLNAITYALWLNKPQNVQEAIRIDLKPNSDIDADVKKPEPSIASSQSSSPLEPILPKSQLPYRSGGTQSWLHHRLLKDHDRLQGSRCGLLWFVIYRIPYRLITSALRPMKKLIVCNPQDGPSPRVPMFGYETPESLHPALEPYLPCLIGASFGLLHVMAWKSGPTELEQQLWRCSTLVITIEPLLFAVAKRLTSRKKAAFSLWAGIGYVLIMLIWFPFIIGLPAYVVARVALFTQALASLRQLPPAAYCDVDWGSFIPHI
ncbi:hypothetical protein AGABI2DRAFT_203489 [Agaricus bisporus var. bisporus H97]|uniref:hypothetical protein n=1 Tax=Agaricus bisporus var. bisporus (strain H97 / ATCC MYA-4626 / FGSC 10389) TaxID=936046 RepID=UPI00029F6439|nr:hypothetical protein AGABI2DRAFT_203489 [Agaricus bisporus var. bisporus H97]EKV48564.1 hypothetical protein AGABI2DRAFT_203489 [Agaricus bisporus var. bisporus H97]